jgi:hypothetical protein
MFGVVIGLSLVIGVRLHHFGLHLFDFTCLRLHEEAANTRSQKCSRK